MTFRNNQDLWNPTRPSAAERSPEEVSPPRMPAPPRGFLSRNAQQQSRQSIASPRSRNVRIRLETKLNTLQHAVGQADPLPQKLFFALPSDLSMVQRPQRPQLMPQDDSLSVTKVQPRGDTLWVRKVQPRKSSVEISAFALATQHMTASEEVGSAVQARAAPHRTPCAPQRRHHTFPTLVISSMWLSATLRLHSCAFDPPLHLPAFVMVLPCCSCAAGASQGH
jgi:hypothetical protein